MNTNSEAAKERWKNPDYRMKQSATRLSQEDITIRLRKVNPSIKVLGKFEGVSKRIKCQCRKCKKVWNPIWSSLERGHGCSVCSNKRQGDVRRISHSEFEKRMTTINPNVQLLGRYIGADSTIKCRCRICNHRWSPFCMVLTSGGGCPKCSYRKRAENLRFRYQSGEWPNHPSTFTKENVQKRLSKISSNIKILSEYKNAITPMKCQCSDCRCVWHARWSDLSQGHGCPQCSLLNLPEQEIDRIAKRFKPYIEIQGERYQSRVTCQCLKCGNEWQAYWRALDAVRGRGCPECGKGLSEEEIQKRLKQVDKTLKFVRRASKYRLKIKCIVCKTTWKQRLSTIEKMQRGCPICHPHPLRISENRTREIIERLTGQKFPSVWPGWLKGRGKRPLQLDGYCPELKSEKFPNGTAVEQQGYQHYKPSHWNGFSKEAFLEQKRRDMRKRVQCIRHGVLLICIPYWKKDTEGFIQDKLYKSGVLTITQ